LMAIMVLTAVWSYAAMPLKADTFTFTYTFSPGTTAAGTFDGTLNGNLITPITLDSLTLKTPQTGPPKITPVPGEFLIMRQSAFGITHDNVPASDKVSTPLVWTPGS